MKPAKSAPQALPEGPAAAPTQKDKSKPFTSFLGNQVEVSAGNKGIQLLNSRETAQRNVQKEIVRLQALPPTPGRNEMLSKLKALAHRFAESNARYDKQVARLRAIMDHQEKVAAEALAPKQGAPAPTRHSKKPR